MRTKYEIQVEIIKHRHAIRTERQMAKYSDRADPRSARIVKELLHRISELEKELDGLE